MSSSIMKRGKISIHTSPQLTLIIIPLVFNVLATLAVIFRFRSRKATQAPLLTDDWLCLFALILAYGCQAINIVTVVGGGASLDSTTLSLDQIKYFFKTYIAMYFLYLATVLALQLSVLFYYERLFGIKRSFRVACYTTMALIVLWFVSTYIASFTACRPVQAFWDPFDYPNAKCVDLNALCPTVGFIHVFFDLVILSLPIPIVWRLQTSRTNKIIVTSVLTVGIFTVVCAIMRLDCIIHIFSTADVTKSSWIAQLFQNLEIPFGIICVCVPTLSPSWKQFLKSRFGTMAYNFLVTRSNRNGSSGRNGKRGDNGRRSSQLVGASAGSSQRQFRRLEENLGGNKGVSSSKVERSNSDEIPLHILNRNAWLAGSTQSTELPAMEIHKTQQWQVKTGHDSGF